MDPIVYGLRRKFSDCLDYERENYHQIGEWHAVLRPAASPENRTCCSGILTRTNPRFL